MIQKRICQRVVICCEQDLEGAEILINSSLKRQEITLFHLQQAIEKVLKRKLSDSLLSKSYQIT